MQCRQRYKQNAFNARKILNRQKLRIRLIALDTATCIEDMDTPGWRLHSLKGDRQGLRAIDVNRNWRIVFEFKDGNAYIVNYEDYH
ncbi:MAG: Killer protein [Desulfobacula sp. GWF2_41_7]|nr:MAG: Killer protein [Desulfobacula sp. GWF2_41_7]